MQAQYKRVIDQFNLTRIDLDIEGGTLDNTAANDRRNQALANLQTQYAAAGKTLAVDYTLPVNPTGLESNSLSLLNNAKSHNLNVSVVNIMTMDYGSAMDMGQAAINAANALHSQLGAIWTTKTSAQLWAMEGNTPMIGVNDTTAEVFTTGNASSLESFAAANGIQLLAFWALGRDNSGSSGTSQSNYQFTNIFKAITGGTTTPPTAAAHGWLDHPDPRVRRQVRRRGRGQLGERYGRPALHLQRHRGPELDPERYHAAGTGQVHGRDLGRYGQRHEDPAVGLQRYRRPAVDPGQQRQPGQHRLRQVPGRHRPQLR